MFDSSTGRPPRRRPRGWDQRAERLQVAGAAPAGGPPALEDRASTPQRQPRRTAPAVTARIVAARYERRTAWAIAVQLQVPRSTVAAVLARAGLNRLARLTPPAPVTRYEWAHPGDLVHLDVKPLARIAGVGHRIHGDRRARVRGIGWEYAHVAIDDHSRAAYVEVLPDQTGATTAAFLARTLAWFARRGVRITRILTDNGGNYRSQRFRPSWWFKVPVRRVTTMRDQGRGTKDGPRTKDKEPRTKLSPASPSPPGPAGRCDRRARNAARPMR